jgi:L-fuculose-phosphate aldolase
MACLLANHGAVCLGEDLSKAFKTCTVLEMTAQIYQMALQIGTPHIIPEDLAAFMRDFAKNHYGQGK